MLHNRCKIKLQSCVKVALKFTKFRKNYYISDGYLFFIKFKSKFFFIWQFYTHDSPPPSEGIASLFITRFCFISFLRPTQSKIDVDGRSHTHIHIRIVVAKRAFRFNAGLRVSVILSLSMSTSSIYINLCKWHMMVVLRCRPSSPAIIFRVFFVRTCICTHTQWCMC